MSKDNNKLIDYDTLVDNALRGVVKTVLKSLESKENIGDHHFFITFITNHKNVDIPKTFHENHPNTMTIVLQHQFWDLKVEDDSFSVTLSFNGKQEKLSIGYNAITQFTDPSTDFALQFASNESAPANEKASKDEQQRINQIYQKLLKIRLEIKLRLRAKALVKLFLLINLKRKNKYAQVCL